MIISLESKTIKPQCELCGKYFKSKGNLRTHIESVHESSKHPCDMCVYKAPNKYSLIQHKNALHKKIKYPCNQCGLQTTTQGSLKTHIQSVHKKISSCLVTRMNKVICVIISELSLYFVK